MNVKGLILTTHSPGEAKGEFWGLGVPSAPVLFLSGVFHVSAWWRRRRRMKGPPGRGQGGGEPHTPAIFGRVGHLGVGGGPVSKAARRG